MYRHILIATDGSRVSQDAARVAIQLARTLGARITALHVVAAIGDPPLGGWAHGGPDFAAKLADSLERRAMLFVEEVRDAARCAGVPCEAVVAHGPSAAGRIVAEARARDCDLVVMASHRGRGAGGLAASETLKVVAMGGIPVLAHHARPPRPAQRSAASMISANRAAGWAPASTRPSTMKAGTPSNR